MIGELTNHLWQSTLFAVLAGLLTVAFRKDRAEIRYWLWFSASFKFFVPFSLLMNLGRHIGWGSTAKGITTLPVSFTVAQFTQPFPHALPSAPAPAGIIVHWIPLVSVGVWVCGFGLITLVRFRGWRRLLAVVRSSAPINVPASIEVRSSPGLLEPGVVGFFHPILLLPAGILERLTPCQLSAVLAHELCHVRRRDNLTAAIHMVVEAFSGFIR
jgi:beta-lactamase regulating signal transducer with metallopeptidase domain